MDETFVTIYLILGVLLRIGVPLAATFLLGWGLRQLDARWRQEAIEANSSREAALVNIWITQPCWEANGCTSKTRAGCQAQQQRELPCWEVFRSNGTLSKQCLECSYRQELPIPMEVPVAF